MAAALYELQGSGDFSVGANGVSGTYRAVVLNAADHDEAEALAEADAPETIAGARRGTMRVSDLGCDNYLCEADYSGTVATEADSDAGKDPGPDPNGPPSGGGNPPAGGAGDGSGEDVAPELEFDTGGGTVHITQARETIDSVLLGGGVAPSTKDAIGVSKDEVKGVDIPAPGGEFSLSYTFSQLSNGYFRRLMAMSGRAVNDAAFKGFEAGEVLFVGCSGHYRAGGKWKLVFRFKFQPNEVNIPVGDQLTIPAKAGWDLIDVLYSEVKDELAGRKVIVQRPYAAYVRRVMVWSDFKVLSI